MPEPEDSSFADAFDALGAKRVVLLGECTHGTSEFYRARAAITRRLVERHGFSIIAVEADWPDAASIHRYVTDDPNRSERLPFQRFPPWMWRNEEFAEFVRWISGGEHQDLRMRLREARLERFIGVIYRPEAELQSHYAEATLAGQFDGYVWFDTTRAVNALATRPTERSPDLYPFGQ